MIATTERPHAILALDLELSHGRHGASARVELHERPDSPPGVRRLAWIGVRGWMDQPALKRLGRALDDLALRGVDQVLLDCAQLRHIDYRLTAELVERLERFEARVGGVVVCGLSRHLRDLFRLSGCEGRLRSWPSASELLEVETSLQPGLGERAS
ncbi:MAG: STAS domain-containing protein [Candidatus Eisenbacteria bacterium]|uniref:STAS domain-containing protein n=1 Tax=Eiseniibacteriota bacterium TaxID=2212470 RepID=A0A849ST05_UNCEI|nr:STAS domain-containing protein [Candidatus Eisenbacteria bacterium]